MAGKQDFRKMDFFIYVKYNMLRKNIIRSFHSISCFIPVGSDIL